MGFVSTNILGARVGSGFASRLYHGSSLVWEAPPDLLGIWEWEPSQVDAMGFHQAVHHDGERWIMGVDVFGPVIGLEDGSTHGWAAGTSKLSTGQVQPYMRKVVGFTSNATHDFVMVGSHNPGTWEGGILRRPKDGSEPWTVVCDAASSAYFAGNGEGTTSTPRLTGRMIAADPDGSHVWAIAMQRTPGATNLNKVGLIRSVDNGATWAEWKDVAGDREFRAIAYSNLNDAVFVSSNEDRAGAARGLQVYTGALAGGTAVRLDTQGAGHPGGLTDAQDMCVVNDGVNDYVVLVCGAQEVTPTEAGVWVCAVGDIDSGTWTAGSTTWTHLGIPDGAVASDWATVAAEWVGGQLNVVAGCFAPSVASAGGYTEGAVSDTYKITHARRLNALAAGTWEHVSGDANVDLTLYGTTSEKWTQATVGMPFVVRARLGGSNHASQALEVVGGVAVSAGKAGAWRTDDIWGTAPVWQPFVNGTGALISRSCAVNPANGAQWLMTDIDRTAYAGTLGSGQTPRCFMVDATPDGIDPSEGLGCWVAPDGSVALIGREESNTPNANAGKIVQITDPWGTPVVALLDLPANVGRAISPFRFTNGTGQVITLVETAAGATQRRVGTGAWAATTGSANGTPDQPGRFMHDPFNPNVVWHFLPEGGLRRSTDSGATWTVQYADTVEVPGSQRAFGDACLIPGTDTILASWGDGIWKIITAAGTPARAKLADGLLSATARVSALACTTTKVFAATVDGDYLLSTDAGATWTDIAGAITPDVAPVPLSASMTNGHLYVTVDGGGMVAAVLT